MCTPEEQSRSPPPSYYMEEERVHAYMGEAGRGREGARWWDLPLASLSISPGYR